MNKPLTAKMKTEAFAMLMSKLDADVKRTGECDVISAAERTTAFFVNTRQVGYAAAMLTFLESAYDAHHSDTTTFAVGQL